MAHPTAHLLHRDLTERVIGVYHDVYFEFGTGYLEKVCQRVMVIALRQAGLDVAEGRRFTVYFRETIVGDFYPDVVVNDLVLVEIKSCPSLEPRHRAQAINYLRASDLEVGLVVNFGKHEFERVAYSNDRKRLPGADR